MVLFLPRRVGLFSNVQVIEIEKKTDFSQHMYLLKVGAFTPNVKSVVK